jgi:hypothetical protein
MSEPDYRDVGIAAAVGFGTGALWAAVTGDLDLSKGRSWRHIVVGAVGSAVNATAINLGSQYAFDQETARIISGTWVGIQASASGLNAVERRYNLESNPFVQAPSFIVNYAAAPLSSTVGMLIGGLGSVLDGFQSPVYFRQGMLIFQHQLCIVPFDTAVVTHCFDPDAKPHSLRHEKSHRNQFSIMGDAGLTLTIAVDFIVGSLFISPAYFMFGPGGSTIEPWAQDTD